MSMPVRRAIADLYWRASSYRLTGEPIAQGRPGILIGAPHTSQWDFVFALVVLWHYGISPKVLVKHTFFPGPVGTVMRALGAVPVDRAQPGRLVDDLIAEARRGTSFALVLTPEGTRSKTDGWKSGFYRIARGTGLPVTPVSIDAPSRTLKVGEARLMTGDVAADMDAFREFFAGAQGIRPGKGSPVRLRDETRDFDASPSAG